MAQQSQAGSGFDVSSPILDNEIGQLQVRFTQTISGGDDESLR